jgi:hypothetical protein
MPVKIFVKSSLMRSGSGTPCFGMERYQRDVEKKLEKLEKYEMMMITSATVFLTSPC